MVAVLDLDPELLERVNRVVAHPFRDGGGGEVKIAAQVEELRRLVILEIEGLHLTAAVTGEAQLLRPVHDAAKDEARVRGDRVARRGHHVAEHPARAAALHFPRQDGKGGRVRLRYHIRFLDACEAFDGRAVKGHAALKGARKLGDRNRHALQEPEDVGEPELRKPDAVFPNQGEDFAGGHCFHASSG